MGLRTTDETKLTLELPGGVLNLRGLTQRCSITAGGEPPMMTLDMDVEAAAYLTESIAAVGRRIVAETPLGPVVGKVKSLSIEDHPRFTGTVCLQVTISDCLPGVGGP